MIKRHHRHRILAALLIEVGIISLAHAADDAPTSPPAPAQIQQAHSSGSNSGVANGNVKTFDAVKVTASRAKQVSNGALGTRSDLETPFSTTTVTAQDLEDRQVKALGKVFAEDAAVMSLGDTYSFNSYSVNVRGIPLDDYNGYKINGTPFYMTTVELPLESFDEVQLLKGSSGFMYGFGAPGGIINFVTKKPTDTYTFNVDTGYSSSGVFSEHIDTGGRVGPDAMFGYRFNATHEQGTTYNGSYVLRNSESLSLDARLTSSLTWSADAIYQSRKVDGGVQDEMLADYTGTSLPKPLSGTTNLSAYDNDWFNSNVYWVSSGLHWKISPAWTATVDYSHSKDERSYSGQWLDLISPNGNFNDYLNQSRGSSIYDQVEARLEGNFTTGPIGHQVILGAAEQWLTKKTVPNYLYQEIGSDNLYQPITPLTWNQPFDYSQQYLDFQSIQKSLYASDTVSFLKYWSILAGVRYIDYRQTSYDTTETPTSSYSLPLFTPSFALMFRPRSDTLVYASYVESLQDGGTAPVGYANANAVLNPIKSKQTELGVKYDGDHFGASAAIYQIQEGAEYGNDQNVYVSNGDERIRGVELNGHVNLPYGFRVAASTSYITGTYSEVEPDLDGKRIEGIPRWQGVLQVSDRIPNLQGVTADVEAHYFGSMMADDFNQYTMPSYTLFNAGVSYRTKLGTRDVTLRAEVDNVFNRHYWGFLQSDYIFVGAPRVVALNARFAL